MPIPYLVVRSGRAVVREMRRDESGKRVCHKLASLGPAQTREEGENLFVHWKKEIAFQEKKIVGTKEIRVGDFRKVLIDIADDSVDLILTDPPYSEDSLPLYDDLGKLAARILKPKGSLICYTGQTLLSQADVVLRKHLRYWWTFSLIHKHGGQYFPGKWIVINWKPILWFVKGTRRNREYFPDLINGSPPQKGLHAWAQGVEEVKPFIEKLTSPGDLIVDPFAGSGSFGLAAIRLGRNFKGAEIDPECIKI